jgi:hypothetical protein
MMQEPFRPKSEERRPFEYLVSFLPTFKAEFFN